MGKKFAKLALQLPEYLLLLATFFYWISVGKLLNPIALVLIGILILQILFKNKVVGIIIPSILIMGSFYMLLALLSEFHEFPAFNADAAALLVTGLLMICPTMAISGIMVYKYAVVES